MSLHIATSIRFCGESIIRIVGFRHGGIVRIGLGYFKTSFHIEYPGGFIVIASFTWIGGNDLAIGSECAQGCHVVHVIVGEARGLLGSTPLGNLSTTKVILVTRRVTHRISYHRRQVMSNVVSSSRNSPGCICYAYCASGNIHCRSRGVTSSINLYQRHS